jgi:hypothetical protein
MPVGPVVAAAVRIGRRPSPVASAAAIVALVGACRFDPSVDASVPIACRDDRGCPDGLVCSADTGRCVEPATLLADRPGLESSGGAALSPVVARGGTLVTLTLRPTRALARPPEAVLLRDDVTLAFSPDAGAVDVADAVFRSTLTVPDDAADGFYPVFVDMVGALGGAVARLPAGVALTIDRTPPSAAVVTAVNERLGSFADGVLRARPGDVLAVEVAASEPLSADPVIAVVGSDGATLTQVSGTAGGGQVATFRVTLPLDVVSGRATLALDGLIDAAGNVTPPTPALVAVDIDAEPPTLSQPSPTRTRLGDRPPHDRLTVPVVVGPGAERVTVGSLDGAFEAECDGIVGEVGCVVEAAALPGGIVPVVITAVDAVGNAALRELLVVVDRSPPRLLQDGVTVAIAPPRATRAVTAAGAGADVIVTMTFDEVLRGDAAFELVVDDTALPCPVVGADANVWTCRARIPNDGAMDGVAALRAAAADLVDNVGVVVHTPTFGGGPLRVDTVAPAPAGASVVVMPWGSRRAPAVADAAQAWLQPDAFEADAAVAVDDDQGRRLAVLLPGADADGGPLRLEEVPTRPLTIAIVDTAGNESPPTPVVTEELRVALAAPPGAPPGVLRVMTTSVLPAVPRLEADGVATVDVDAFGADGAAVVGDGVWLQRRPTLRLVADLARRPAVLCDDPHTGRVLLLDQPTSTGVLAWDGGRLVDEPAAAAPALVTASAWDAHRELVVVLDDRLTLWSLERGGFTLTNRPPPVTFRADGDATPEPTAVLAFDAEGDRLVVVVGERATGVAPALTFTWSPASPAAGWQPVTSAVVPAARAGAWLVDVPGPGVLLGGGQPTGDDLLWMLDDDGWHTRPVDAASLPLLRRSDAGVAVDDAAGLLVVAGGAPADPSTPDTAAWPLDRVGGPPAFAFGVVADPRATSLARDRRGGGLLRREAGTTTLRTLPLVPTPPGGPSPSAWLPAFGDDEATVSSATGMADALGGAAPGVTLLATIDATGPPHLVRWDGGRMVVRGPTTLSRGTAGLATVVQVGERVVALDRVSGGVFDFDANGAFPRTPQATLPAVSLGARIVAHAPPCARGVEDDGAAGDGTIDGTVDGTIDAPVDEPATVGCLFIDKARPESQGARVPLPPQSPLLTPKEPLVSLPAGVLGHDPGTAEYVVVASRTEPVVALGVQDGVTRTRGRLDANLVGAVLAVDAARQRLLACAAEPGAPVWEERPDLWVRRRPWSWGEAGGPAARGAAVCAWDAARDRLILAFGKDGPTLLPDVWELGGTATSRPGALIHLDVPAPRTLPGAPWRSLCAHLVVAGRDAEGRAVDVEVLSWVRGGHRRVGVVPAAAGAADVEFDCTGGDDVCDRALRHGVVDLALAPRAANGAGAATLVVVSVELTLQAGPPVP